MNELASANSSNRDPHTTSQTSVTERTFNRIDSALSSLSDTIDQAESAFAPALRTQPPVLAQEKAPGEIVKEVQQSRLHGALVVILDKIDEQQRRLASLTERSTL